MDTIRLFEAASDEIPGQLAFFPDEQTAEVQQVSAYTAQPQLVLRDPSKICILICDILSHFDGILPEEWLYRIMVGSGHINYFLYADAVGFLQDNLSMTALSTNDGEQYILTEKGKECAAKLRQFVPKLFRDQVLLTALRFVARQRALRDLEFSYEPDEAGCMLCVQCRDQGQEMLSLRIHAPSHDSAVQLGERILRNPSGVFGKILDLVMHNEEEAFDLSDN